MCNSKIQSGHAMASAAVAEIDGRPVLQPASNTSNRIATPEAGRPLKKTFHKSISLPTSFTKHAARSDVVDPGAATLPKLSPPVSPKLKPAAKAAPKRSNDPNGLNTSTDKPSAKSRPAMMTRSKSSVGASQVVPSLDSSLLSCDRAPGSIAAAQREHAVLMQAQRKMRIAHYGRTPAKLEGKVVPVDSSVLSDASGLEEKRCSFITPNSDPVNIAYHDQEWGVPVHDDKMLFELLVLAGAQVGLDWTTILKKRGEFRAAFAEFDAELVSKYTEKQMASISAAYGLDLGRVRGVVDNAKRILEVHDQVIMLKSLSSSIRFHGAIRIPKMVDEATTSSHETDGRSRFIQLIEHYTTRGRRRRRRRRRRRYNMGKPITSRKLSKEKKNI
ncbi:Methyladenine glycosylase [Musa troglodytarum]|uniref:Methyladenine glycosylase n=1 Tax=Musa troglodytarum TaxID=320322 RepID=A0A9E7FQP0_9LILI|nr:Methyladenine glycosylase [Musa troglodytarum]